MKVIADLHFHSKYSRAVSPQMVLPEIVKWAKIKGIDLLTTSDFTHPLWLRELKSNLEEAGEGIYKLKSEIRNSKSETKEPLFLFTTEISSIYTQGGKLRRIHNLIFAPSLQEAEKIGTELARRGNVMSDGRPIFGLSAREITELIFSISPQALVVPAHCWTPHFSLYGSQSGFDSLEECFGNMAKYIYAVETGLSSDPAMNWRIQDLDNRTLISCSDAHSGAKLGREATVFALSENGISNFPFPISNFSYEDIRKAIKGEPGRLKISHTIEFYPEEGKYHYTGHRNCGVRQSPEETNRLGTTCPVCGRGLTVGVMHRVQQLAGREISAKGGSASGGKNEKLKMKNDEFGMKWIGYENRPPYAMLVPLLEILAESLKSTVSSQKTINEYKNLTLLRPPEGETTEGQASGLRGEFGVLLETPLAEIAKISGEKVAEAIQKVRLGEIVVEPGYDGVFGKVKIWPLSAKSADRGEPLKPERDQMSLF